MVLGRLDCSPKRVWYKCSYVAAIAEVAARLRVGRVPEIVGTATKLICPATI